MDAPAEPRPARGLGLEEALARWSAAGAYEAMREYWDARVRVSMADGVEPSAAVLRHQEYARRRGPLEEALHAKAAAGELAVSVLPQVRTPQTSRVVVHPGIFQEAEIAWDLDEIVGLGMRLRSPEFFEPEVVPRNVWDIPDWYADAFRLTAARAGPVSISPSPPFRHSANYRHAEASDVSFALSVAQARIVRRLHEAHLAGDPWVPTREVLRAANSASDRVAHVFRRHTDPHWSLLIESNGKGLYRLRVGAGE